MQQTEIEMITRSATLCVSLLSAVTLAGLASGAMAQDAVPAAAPAPAAAVATPPAAAPAAAAATQAPAATAPAQEGGAAYESARNQLGVLSYCQDKGYIDTKAVETQTKLLGLIPAGDSAKGDAAEAKGREGTVSAMGVERTLADAAKEKNTTEDALCKQMDTLLQQLAAQVPA
jgi:putative hemolysin